MCFVKISIRGRNRTRSPCCVCFLLLQWLLRCWAPTESVEAAGTSGLATNPGNFKDYRCWKGISGCAGLCSRSLLDLK